MLEDVNYINNKLSYYYYYYNRPQQNQCWNQQRPNYSGNYQGNNSYNNNNNFPPLKELVSNQGKLMDNFFTAIKNQISFNKMIESQLNQIDAAVPTTNPGIPSQPEGLESANLVDMFDAGNYWSNPVVKVITDLLPVKRGDPGRPVILISIGMVDFPEALCDFSSSVNIMPRLADRTLSLPKGILKNLCVRVGTLYAPADFVVVEIGTDESAPIIIGRPFLNTSGAVIYASAAKISFYIKERKETFSFKNKITQISEQSRHEPRKRTNRRNRNKQMWTESSKMVTAIQGGQDRRLKSPFLTKMADQSFRKVEGIVTDVPVKIDDHFVHTDFQVIDMGEDE